MLELLIPFGTETEVTIRNVEAVADTSIVVCDDADRSAYVLIGGPHDVIPHANHRVVIRFVPGGPKGGYWRIVRECEIPF